MYELTVAGWTVEFDNLTELRDFCDWLEGEGAEFEIAVKDVPKTYETPANRLQIAFKGLQMPQNRF